QLRANIKSVISENLQLRCRILPDVALRLRTRIYGTVSTSVEVDYDIRVPITVPLVVTFNATGSAKQFEFLNLRARILKPVSTGIVITYEVPYEMPTDCLQYPTQRLFVRSIRDFSLRCRIRK